MSAQPQAIDDQSLLSFLNDAGWQDSHISPMSADMGLRQYLRLEKNNKRALFMDTSRCGERESLKNFMRVADYLRGLGVNTPEILAYDIAQGFSVIEQMGTQSFGDKIKEGHHPAEVYNLAVGVLAQINNQVSKNDLNLVLYEDTHVRECLNQFVEYYVPQEIDDCDTGALQVEYQAVLNKIETKMPPCPMGFCHADFHLENIMWYPNSDEGYGLIDFQDAFWGFKGYDLLNLLEDARQTVPEDIKLKAKAVFCAEMGADERQNFDDWYALMSMHFHCRVIGLFIKFARENGGVEFLAHIPRLQGYIIHNLENPVLAPLKEFMERHNVTFNKKII